MISVNLRLANILRINLKAKKYFMDDIKAVRNIRELKART